MLLFIYNQTIAFHLIDWLGVIWSMNYFFFSGYMRGYFSEQSCVQIKLVKINQIWFLWLVYTISNITLEYGTLIINHLEEPLVTMS